jgi:magnesium transporter
MEDTKQSSKSLRRRLFKRKVRVGEVPGHVPKATRNQNVSVRVIRYDEDSHSDETLTTKDDIESVLTRIAEASASADSSTSRGVVWINVDAGQKTSVLQTIGDAFGLHPLSLEDVNHVHQRVKCEKYDDTVFFIARMPINSHPFDTEQVAIFLIGGVVITFQERTGDCLDSLRRRIAKSMGRVRSRDADYLFYAILDRIVDEFFVTMERYDDLLGEMSASIESTSQHGLPLKLHHIRDELLQIRKLTAQYREAFKRLAIDGSDLFDPDTQYFIRDCQDHISQLIEASDLAREYCGELRELHFAMLGQKSNDISKVLTIIATVFIPMSFISGVYGMNFDTEVSPLNLPELHWAWGYPFALAMMGTTGGALFFYLYRRGWLR